VGFCTMLDLECALVEEIFSHSSKGLGIFDTNRDLGCRLCPWDGDCGGYDSIRRFENIRVDIFYGISSAEQIQEMKAHWDSDRRPRGTHHVLDW
jgi:hypothetical protein